MGAVEGILHWPLLRLLVSTFKVGFDTITTRMLAIALKIRKRGKKRKESEGKPLVRRNGKLLPSCKMFTLSSNHLGYISSHPWKLLGLATALLRAFPSEWPLPTARCKASLSLSSISTLLYGLTLTLLLPQLLQACFILWTNLPFLFAFLFDLSLSWAGSPPRVSFAAEGVCEVHSSMAS